MKIARQGQHFDIYYSVREEKKKTNTILANRNCIFNNSRNERGQKREKENKQQLRTKSSILKNWNDIWFCFAILYHHHSVSPVWCLFKQNIVRLSIFHILFFSSFEWRVESTFAIRKIAMESLGWLSNLGNIRISIFIYFDFYSIHSTVKVVGSSSYQTRNRLYLFLKCTEKLE